MKVFLSSTYIDLIEHRKAAYEESHPRMRPRIHELTLRDSSIRVIFVDGLPTAQETLAEIEKAIYE